MDWQIRKDSKDKKRLELEIMYSEVSMSIVHVTNFELKGIPTMSTEIVSLSTFNMDYNWANCFDVS